MNDNSYCILYTICCMSVSIFRLILLIFIISSKKCKNQTNIPSKKCDFNSYYLEMFDTLKLIYTQDEALELVSRYEEAYKEKIKELEDELEYVRTIKDSAEETLKEVREENRKLKEKYDWLWGIYTSDVNSRIKENKKLKEKIKDRQLYEEKLEHRIIEFEELLHWE